MSEDMTSMRFSYETQQLPENPERFNRWVCILGSEGFSSGEHSWDVHVGEADFWRLGVVKKSVKRKGDVPDTPAEGVWSVLLFHRNYEAVTSPPTLLTVVKKPQKIRVQLDWDKGQLGESRLAHKDIRPHNPGLVYCEALTNVHFSEAPRQELLHAVCVPLEDAELFSDVPVVIQQLEHRIGASNGSIGGVGWASKPLCCSKDYGGGAEVGSLLCEAGGQSPTYLPGFNLGLLLAALPAEGVQLRQAELAQQVAGTAKKVA
ncbi:hypothetical protein Z043_123835 [Scleropages formosus]|uniref:B30.2/SPRY domain-containing protein n=1 Tax=Scleropages formosus TaxID=113540 RepID=A0A0P7TBY0_SCLFO|nr:hypothetical protein Z043_123835 [Scleropages formosus]